MLIENIIGLEFRADCNEVIFRLNSRERCGLENMMFGDNKISVVCTHYEPFKGKTLIRTSAEKPFKLKVVTKYLWYPVELSVPAGENQFEI